MWSALSLLPKLLIPALVVLVLQLLRRYCRPDIATGANFPPPSLAELDQRYRRTQWWMNALWLLYATLVAATGWAGPRFGNQLIANLDGPAVFRLYPSGATWCFLPFLGAVTFSVVLFEWTLPHVLGKQEGQLYRYWYNTKSAFNVSKVFRWFTLGITLPVGLLTLIAIPVHTSVQQDAMRFTPYGHLRPIAYRYERIRAITTTQGIRGRDGSFVHDPCILVTFDDGTRWSSGDLLRDPDPAINKDLLAFLVTRSGVQPVHQPLEYDLSR